MWGMRGSLPPLHSLRYCTHYFSFFSGRFFVNLFFFYTAVQALLCVLALFYQPKTGPCPPPPATATTDSTAAQGEGAAGGDYQEVPSVPADEQVCPRITWGWYSGEWACAD